MGHRYIPHLRFAGDAAQQILHIARTVFLAPGYGAIVESEAALIVDRHIVEACQIHGAGGIVVDGECEVFTRCERKTLFKISDGVVAVCHIVGG